MQKATIVVENGYLAIPDKPGWGYEMDEEAFKRMPPKPWHRASHSRRMAPRVLSDYSVRRCVVALL
jgi:hypothetical protein